MDNLVVCINAVMPLLITMLLGFAARRLGMLGDNEITKMNSTAFFFFVPCLLFDSIYSADISSAINIKLLLYTSLGMTAVFFAGILAARKITGDRKKQSVVLLGIFRSNCAILGMPLALNLIPDGDISAAAVLIVVVGLVSNVLAVVCMSMFSGERQRIGAVLWDMVKNPLLIGSGLGILFAGLGWRLPGFAERVVSDFALVSSPLLLFLLGASFKFEGVEQNGRELWLICVTRLLLVPAIFLPLGWFMGFRSVEMAGLIAAFASPAAVTSFTLAQQMDGDVNLAGNMVIFTSALCPLTLFGWCMLAKIIGAL